MTDQQKNLLIGGLVLLLVFGFIRSNPKKEVVVASPSPVVIATPVATPVPSPVDVLRATYMEGCDTSPGYTDFCSCTYGFMMQENGVEGLLKIAAMPAAQMEVAMQPAINACITMIK